MAVGPLQGQQAPQLDQRLRVILDAQLQLHVFPRFVAAHVIDHQDRRALLTAQVAALGLGRVEGGQKALGQIPSLCLKGHGHRRPDAVVGHNVGLHRKALPHLVARLGHTLHASVRRHAALRIDHRHLAHRPAFVRRQERGQHLGCRLACGHRAQAQRAEGRVDHGLSSHGTHARLGPAHQAAHVEPVGLHGHAQVARGRVARDDGKGAGQLGWTKGG
ncbi:MAG: hypothetical protein BWY10_02261 [Chloroflexi bacterium ADurb.Bin180]|nr:MAG: hypothetical protein BWY10_02261 [Chloroflexi bacterium ADurb.Bin180]